MDAQIGRTARAYNHLTTRRYFKPSDDRWSIEDMDGYKIITRMAGSHIASFIYRPMMRDSTAFDMAKDAGLRPQMVAHVGGNEFEAYAWSGDNKIFLSLPNLVLVRDLGPTCGGKEDIGKFEHALGFIN